MKYEEAKIQAETAIASALKAFEVNTGSIVRGVRIEDIDITAMMDRTKKMVRHVSIDAEYLPGSNWSQST